MVQFLPMTQAEYDAWHKNTVQEFAADKVEAGNWEAADAHERSAEEFRRLLPQGTATPDNYLYSIFAPPAPGQPPRAVGQVWFAVPPWKPPIVFVYDLAIDQAYRRRGYARQALLALEDEVKALGLDTIGLHVFGHNRGARALYEQAGYQVTDINMAKKLR
jgi:ribosomal protein S18 acetylase RimI-like enzyme